MIERGLAAARETGATVAAVPLNDTIKHVDQQTVVSTPNRDELRIVQTPQVFRASTLIEAHSAVSSDVTDDASMVEYAFIRATPIIAVRSGVWLDPDHRIRTVGDDAVERALLRGGDDELHYTVGLGFAFERFQIDLGADLSELVDRVALSAIYNF